MSQLNVCTLKVIMEQQLFNVCQALFKGAAGVEYRYFLSLNPPSCQDPIIIWRFHCFMTQNVSMFPLLQFSSYYFTEENCLLSVKRFRTQGESSSSKCLGSDSVPSVLEITKAKVGSTHSIQTTAHTHRSF